MTTAFITVPLSTQHFSTYPVSKTNFKKCTLLCAVPTFDKGQYQRLKYNAEASEVPQ